MPLELQTLFEASDVPRTDLPDSLAEAYGVFCLPERVRYANFVASVDGITALPDVPRSSVVISGGDPADRFVVALLRASADALIIGAGTFRAHGGPWTAERAYPDAADGFVELRRREGMSPHPTLVVVSGSGDLGGAGPKLRGAIVATTSMGADRARAAGKEGTEIVVVGDGERVDLPELMRMLSERGHRRVLTEGGPMLMGQLLQAKLIEELFLTVSPILAGGGERGERSTLAAGVDLLSGGSLRAKILSVRRYDSSLFLRYALHPERLEGG